MTIKSRVTERTLKQIEKKTKVKLTLGGLISAIRQSEEISQAAFAEMLEISRQHLCDIERGRKSISPKLAAAYADKLGYSREQFIRLCLQDMIDRAGLAIEVDIRVRHK